MAWNKWPVNGLNPSSTSKDIGGLSQMSPAELVACYRLYASNCMECAQELAPERKLALLNIAQAWLNLADQVAKNSETVLVYETPSPSLPRPPAPPSPET